MARYVANIDTSYKQSVPYHFTCQYCGEVNRKFYELDVRVKASGSARNLGDVRRQADRQHDRQVKKSVKKQKRAIEKYRGMLADGSAVTDKKVQRIPLVSQCDHCGKRQMWNPPPRPDVKPGHMEPVGVVGLILAILGGLGALGTGFVWLMSFGEKMSPVIPAVCAVALLAGIAMTAVGSAIDERKYAAWFKANLTDEPNDPDKLPVIDA